MTYEEIIAGLRALRPSDFDCNNVKARGRERLYELTNALKATPGGPPEAAIPELFGVMERMPDADLGSPGPLVHTLETFRGYETELLRSVRRSPSQLSVWMVNRILNTDLPSADRESYLSLLKEVAARSDVQSAVRDDAGNFVQLQMRNQGLIR